MLKHLLVTLFCSQNSAASAPAIRVRSHQIARKVCQSSDRELVDSAFGSGGDIRTSIGAGIHDAEMSAADYEEIKEIGRGTYGTVWLIKHKDNRKVSSLVSLHRVARWA
jgi:serine/threonine protein kinase